MAIRNPPDLYNGAAVVFNGMPYLQFELRKEAEKKAKNEALDEYYQKLPSTINDAGVRDEERVVITQQKLPELQRHWLENKDKIKNPKLDGGVSQLKHEKMFRDIQDITERSKSAAKTQLELGKMRFDPKMSYVFDDDEVMDEIRRHQLPLTDPEHRTIDLLKLTSPAAPFEQSGYLKQFDKLPMKPLAPEVVKNKDFTQTITQKYAYDTQGLDAIQNMAATQFKNDKSFRSFVKKELDNPETLKELQQIFQEKFKRPLQSYEDMATAYTIKSLPEKVDAPKIVDDWEARDNRNFQQQRQLAQEADARARSRIRLNDTLAKARKALSGKKSAEEQESVLNKFINTQYNDPDAKSGYVTHDGKRYDGKFVNDKRQKVSGSNFQNRE
jgi:hypothetical protein